MFTGGLNPPTPLPPLGSATVLLRLLLIVVKSDFGIPSLLSAFIFQSVIIVHSKIINIVRSLRDREVACSTSDCQGF